jgi:hypothetical protein
MPEMPDYEIYAIKNRRKKWYSRDSPFTRKSSELRITRGGIFIQAYQQGRKKTGN